MTPVTQDQWQDAVDAAYFMQQLAMAQLYGLMVAGPEINIERCIETLKAGRERGVLPKLEHLSLKIGRVIESFSLEVQKRGKIAL